MRIEGGGSCLLQRLQHKQLAAHATCPPHQTVRGCCIGAQQGDQDHLCAAVWSRTEARGGRRPIGGRCSTAAMRQRPSGPLHSHLWQCGVIHSLALLNVGMHRLGLAIVCC